MTIPDIKFRGTFDSINHHYMALKCAHQFMKDYPDRVGLIDGVGYRTKCGCIIAHELNLYVYRTAGGMIVVYGS